MTSPLIQYTVDRDGALAEHINALSAPTAGRVSLFATPSHNCARLVGAMGQDQDRSRNTACHQLTVWLAAREMTDAFIYGIDLCKADQLTALAEAGYI